MKEKPNEWVSIADLMAGTMAVVMLLLVVAVLQNQYAAIKHRQELAQSAVTKQQRVGIILADIKRSFDEQGASNLVSFDMQANKMTLKDNVFARGSACVTKQAQTAFESVEPEIVRYLQQAQSGQIVVEGYTDNLPVEKPVVDFARFCTVYDDNYTLSAARAREARKLLTNTLDPSAARRVIVAGFGDSRPLPEIDPGDPRNRRVEVSFGM